MDGQQCLKLSLTNRSIGLISNPHNRAMRSSTRLWSKRSRWTCSCSPLPAASVCAMLGIAPGEGYRAITNAGGHGGQEVPHYHLHLLGGRPLGRMVEKS